jgi:hypothetical protein
MKVEEAAQLIRSLSETRSVEVKRWFDPASPVGKAKLVKGLLALRNFDGGVFIVGFDDTTMQPDLANAPADVRAVFHPDVVQEVVSRHCSLPFDVEVLFPELDGQEYVVIAVPSGVISPVAVKKGIDNGSGHHLVNVHDIYFRTLAANNRVSSAKIPYSDLPELVGLCFDNREADIGRFLRRHLSGVASDTFRALADELDGRKSAGPSIDDDLASFLADGEARYVSQLKERGLILPPHGTFEVALIIVGDCASGTLDQEFLRLLDTNNPRLTGWPVWLDSSSFSDASSRPYVLDDGWEALIASLDRGLGSDHIDFMRKMPSGRFYLRRGLQDDLARHDRAPEPLKALDFALTVLRTAEAIAVGRAFANAMKCDPEMTTLEFAFRWTGLKGRTLSSWANPERYLSGERKAVQDEITVRLSVPLFSAPETVAAQTYSVVSRLFAIFEGVEISAAVVDDLVTRLLERRL